MGLTVTAFPISRFLITNKKNAEEDNNATILQAGERQQEKVKGKQRKTEGKSSIFNTDCSLEKLMEQQTFLPATVCLTIWFLPISNILSPILYSWRKKRTK